jgi:hypothetical protein
MTDENLFDFSNHEVFYNSYNNEALLKNLVNIVDPKDFISLAFNLSGINPSFTGLDSREKIELSNESNFALAA